MRETEKQAGWTPAWRWAAQGEKAGKKLWIPAPLVERVEQLLSTPSPAEPKPEADWQGWSLDCADRVNLIKAGATLSNVVRHFAVTHACARRSSESRR